MSAPNLFQRAFLALQYLLPHHLLSKVVYRATRWKFGLWKNGLIKLIIWRFKPNLSEAESSTLDSYPSMNAFFTRSLKRGTRLIDASPGGLCSPADGVISQIGSIDQDRLIQAKGRTFSAEQLLGNDPAAKAFTNGQFTTIYLSPKDYHRIHMPLAGKLLQTTYVPGRLFSVAPLTTQHIPNLFARNERLACMFETEFGPMAVVLVGAMLVSSIETVWAGECGTLTDIHHQRPAEPVELDKGAEMGRFNMGSTVIVLLGDSAWQWSDELAADDAVRVGERIGSYTNN